METDEQSTIKSHLNEPGQRDRVSISQEKEHLLPSAGKAVGWLLVFILIYFAAAILYFVIYGIYMGITHPGVTSAELQAEITQSAEDINSLGLIFILQFIAIVPVVLLASNFKNQHWKTTLAFNSVSIRTVGVWAGIWLVYGLVFTGLSFLFEIPDQAFLLSLNGSKSLLIAIVLVFIAPVMEELIFRGYLFAAWRNTRLGFIGTLTITALLFTGLHVAQYTHWLLFMQLFVLALILGFAREKTGSIVTPMIVHGLQNLCATIFVVFLGIL